ncbi:hypothetical protein CDEST_03306 [Colletotrichum destructivum]|uniref:Uncharacterized protein n=1 Tax=Colletotrichum destructivum TaxID=34406 RepID=A0AAX4I4Q8_9PEZI|nr:hypothetical protein CDEST_03306 [Colletotrichum destructivum]
MRSLFPFPSFGGGKASSNHLSLVTVFHQPDYHLLLIQNPSRFAMSFLEIFRRIPGGCEANETLPRENRY